MERIPYYLKKSSTVQREIIQHPRRLPISAMHLSALKIQQAWRSRRPQPQTPSKKTALREQFSKSIYSSQQNGYQHFCAAKIQSYWKMRKLRRMYQLGRFEMYQVAARLIQTAWKYFRMRLQQGKPLTPDSAASKLQRAWRGYTNQKIFKYFKDLISFRLKGNPKDLLKTINPGEAAILDRSTSVHVRFRLGGEKFPPLIYYKIYLHNGLCDVNSFAPRDYTAIKRFTKKQTVNITFEEEDAKNIVEGWYERFDNNGWRPITDNILSAFDRVELITSSKPVPFHYNKIVRKEILAKRKREKKINWLRKLYDEGRRVEEHDDQEFEKDLSSFEGSVEVDGNPFEVENLIDLSDGEFDEYAKGLMKWSETLDFDGYISNWYQLATSAPIDNAEET